MRVVLADLRGEGGFVSKDTVAGGYGARLRPFSKVTRVVCAMKRRVHHVPSVQLAYIAAVCAAEGHQVHFTDKDPVDGDVAIVLSSLVDHRRETAFADAMRARGVPVGFVGLTASKMPQLFAGHADFIVNGEPEHAVARLAKGETLRGDVRSPAAADLDTLPFPRWDLVQAPRRHALHAFAGRPLAGVLPMLASRGCPEFCTYCPHRIWAGYRGRSVANLVDELSHVASLRARPYVLFRDPLFTENRTRCLELADAIRSRGLDLRFSCETRLDRLDPALLDALYDVGLREINFGVESLSPETLRRAGRRPIPPAHQKLIVDHCRSRGIVTAAFFVLGFLPDTWESVSATIDFAIELGPTVAQFKILTPYPATPMWKQLQPRIFEQDWERFDGFTPTFTHPNLTPEQLRFLLGAAYTRFYMRPSYLLNYLRIGSTAIRRVVNRLDDLVEARHAREELGLMSRTVTC